MPKTKYNDLTLRLFCNDILHNFDKLQAMSLGQLIVDLRYQGLGMGITEIARILKRRDYPYIIVDNETEASKVSKISTQPLLIANPDLSLKPKHVIIVSSLDELYSIRYNCEIHLNLRTGHGPRGINVDNLKLAIDYINKTPRIDIVGIMSELDNPENFDTSQLRNQIRNFDKMVEDILDAGLEPKYYHLADNIALARTIRSKYANTSRVSYTLFGINTLDSADFDKDNLQPLKTAFDLVCVLHRSDTDDKSIINIYPVSVPIGIAIDNQIVDLASTSSYYYCDLSTNSLSSRVTLQPLTDDGFIQLKLLRELNFTINRTIVWK